MTTINAMNAALTNADANAHLIAAAPDMRVDGEVLLDAIVDFVPLSSVPRAFWDCVDAFRAAITKAEGGQS